MTSPDTIPTPIVIVGHVDHGKSTLIGRLLHDTGNLLDGRVDAARQSSERRGLDIEWSFLLDSLQAERDQGVTIDSTRMPFRLDGRPFVIVDAPGHRQFLRNMVTGAEGAAAAVLVVDAADGVQDQTRRHVMVLRLVGVRRVVVVLNKADLLGFAEAALRIVQDAVAALLAQLELTPLAFIPVSARAGDNVARRSGQTPWYAGPTLTAALAALPPPAQPTDGPLRLPVQDVYRFDDRRLVAGCIAAGRVAVGDTLAIGTTGSTAQVVAIEAWQAPPQASAAAGQSVALVLHPDVVVQRGDLLYPPAHPPMRAARLRARLFWLRPEPLRIGETFRLRLASAEYTATIASIDAVVQLDDLSMQPADQVGPEGFAEITLAVPEGVLFDPFEPGGLAGRGVLVDSHQRIVGGAPLLGPAELTVDTRAVYPVESIITAQQRARAKGYRGAVFWLTGLPASGKSTLASAAEAFLFQRQVDAVLLDGDTLRARLNADLGFSDADRDENVRRTAAVARLMADSGLVVLVALVSPRAAHRAKARQLVGDGFHEIHVHADVAVCAARDPKGLYAAARAGQVSGFTGVGAGYDMPEAPDLRLDTGATPVAACVDTLVHYIESSIKPQ